MAIACASTVEFCAVRATRLNADGSVDYDTADNVYVVRDLIQLTFNSNVSEGTDREMLGGCGCRIAQKTDDDDFLRYDLELQAGRLELGFMEMLTGGTVVEGTDGPVGYMNGAKRACGTPQNRVAFEAWSKRWTEDNEWDPIHPWWHWVYPATRWVPGNNTLQADFGPIVLNGKTNANTAWGEGPYGEQPADMADQQQGVFIWDGDLPESTCDYSTITT